MEAARVALHFSDTALTSEARGGERQAAVRLLQDRHLAIFMHSFSGGGAQRRAITIANALAAEGLAVDLVVVSARGVLRGELSDGVNPVQLDSPATRFPLAAASRRSQLFASVPALARYLRRRRPDVLLSAASHVTVPSAWAARLAGGQTRLVLRVSNHLSRSSINGQRTPRIVSRWLARRCYPLADAIVAVSEGVGEDLARSARVPRSRITTIYNPVVSPALEEKARQPVDHPWFAPGAPPVILGVGRLVAQKDFPTLLRAFARVRRQRMARLLILGRVKKPARRERLLRLAADLGIGSDVEIPGFVPDPLPYMARASVFALSSRWEGLPGVLIEAMACGCPVVSTDCPSGPAEILAGGRYGPLVPPGKPDALADAIVEVLDHPPDPQELRQGAQRFSCERGITAYLCLFARLVAGEY